MKKIVTALVTAVTATLLTGSPAHAGQLEEADREVKTQRMTYVEWFGTRGMYFELNDGSTYRAFPCKYEDGSGQPNGCYWNASIRGNGIGTSFVVLPGSDSTDRTFIRF